jgi:hypothetical protein
VVLVVVVMELQEQAVLDLTELPILVVVLVAV